MSNPGRILYFIGHVSLSLSLPVSLGGGQVLPVPRRERASCKRYSGVLRQASIEHRGTVPEVFEQKPGLPHPRQAGDTFLAGKMKSSSLQSVVCCESCCQCLPTSLLYSFQNITTLVT